MGSGASSAQKVSAEKNCGKYVPEHPKPLVSECRDCSKDEKLDVFPLEDTASNERCDRVHNNKLKKMALGIQGYKDHQRDYDATLASLDLNKTTQLEWSEPKITASLLSVENRTLLSPPLMLPFQPGSSSSSMIMSPVENRRPKELASPLSSYPNSNSSSFHGGLSSRPNGQSFYIPPGNLPVRPFPHEQAEYSASHPVPVSRLHNSSVSSSHHYVQGSSSFHSLTYGAVNGVPVNVGVTSTTKQFYNHAPPSSIGPSFSPASFNAAAPFVNNVLSFNPSGPAQFHGSAPPRVSPIIQSSPAQPAPPTHHHHHPPSSSSHYPVSSPVALSTQTLNLRPINGHARPPTSSVPVPVVKETKNVKRNKIQLPAKISHATPTTGDWLNKRYIVNNYILLDTLGAGSYGEVRLCKDRVSEKLFAIKIISKDFLKKKKNGKTSETYFEDIKREIAIMKKLLHPNILRLYEVLDDPKVIFFCVSLLCFFCIR
jgi:hypothetical protein